MWSELTDLFADDGSIEIGLDGVYRGKDRIHEYLLALGQGREGLAEGELNEHFQVMPVVTVDPDGAAAQGLAPSDDEYDAVVASGEQVTAGLLAMTLRHMGQNARSWLGWQVPIYTDEAHGKARIDEIPGENLMAAMEEMAAVCIWWQMTA